MTRRNCTFFMHTLVLKIILLYLDDIAQIASLLSIKPVLLRPMSIHPALLTTISKRAIPMLQRVGK